MKTSTVKQPAQGTWYIVDAQGQTLGHIASNIAYVLRGKHKPTFSPHQLCSDQVVVVNVEKMAISPMKLRKKVYYHHTGYLGHMQTRTLEKMMQDTPERVLEIAIKGMLPSNRLRPRMLKHLHIHTGSEHRFAAQKPVRKK